MITKETLYDMLPDIYRKKDQELGNPLGTLLDVIARQANIIEYDIGELYDNWFIETCKKWVVPYIGDLLGVQNIDAHSSGFSERALVANQIAHMRRKGTLHSLEQLGRDITGWNTRSVEFFKLLPITQNLNHLNMKNKTIDLRQTNELELLDSPFDSMCHTLDTKTIQDEKGWYNISNFGLFFWRLQTFPIVDSTAFDHKDGKFSFDPLGFDMQLYNNPVTEKSISDIAEEINLPGPIRRKGLKKNFYNYYGDHLSFSIKVNGLDVDGDKIIVSNLEEWENKPRSGMISVDPELGRILFPQNEIPKQVHVSYYYAFSGAIGSHPFSRNDSLDETLEYDIKKYYIIKNENIRKESVLDREYNSTKIFSSLPEAIDDWQSTIDNQNKDVVFEIMDSEIYDEPISTLSLKSGVCIKIRSKIGQRPVLKFAEPLRVKSNKQNSNADHESKLILEGLLIDYNHEVPEPKSLIKIEDGDLRHLIIENCTLVPNLTNQKSVNLSSGNERLIVYIKNSIVGRINLRPSDAKLYLIDSIVDGQNTGSDSDSISCYSLSVENCTIIGSVNATILTNAKNSIFSESMEIKRRQEGIVEFCYVMNNSKCPKCYKCIFGTPTNSVQSNLFTANMPNFTSLRFGDPGYAQLDIHNTPKEILEGADNLQEIGVFNYLNQTSKINNFKSSLDKYLRFGKETAMLFVT